MGFPSVLVRLQIELVHLEHQMAAEALLSRIHPLVTMAHLPCFQIRQNSDILP